jgi:GAF domain-containing protein
LDALASLNQIGAAINQLGPRANLGGSAGAADGVKTTLRLIVESAIKVVPGSSAVIYTYDQGKRVFDLASRVSAGEGEDATVDDTPRPDGIGARAVRQRRPVLSYEEGDLDIHPAKVCAGARAMACFALEVAEQVVGVLYVYLHQERQFTQFELLMLDNFVNQAAMAIYQARRLADVQRDLDRKEDELDRLRRAGLLISSRLGLEQTLEVILQIALEVTGARYGIFRLMDTSGQLLIARAVAGEHLGEPRVEALPIDQSSVMSWVARHRQPLRIHDLHAAPWCQIYYPLGTGIDMRSELAVPLIGASGRLEGVLNLESPAIGAFSEQDRHLLQSLATQAVIAIQEVRLLDALQEVAELLLVQPAHQVLDHLVDLARDLLNASASAIWMLEDDHLILWADGAGFERDERLPLYGSLTGQAILVGRAVTTDNVRTDPRFHRPDLARAQNWDRALVVPLLSSDDREPIGAFSVYSTIADPGRFAESEWDEKVLTCLAHYAALAVHNAARQDALRVSQEQHAVAETFAVVGDVAANLLHHLNNKVGTIPVRIQGIQDKCQPALLADAYLATNLREIERSASEAMATVRKNLAHLRPIRLAPTSVASCVDSALQSADLADSIVVDVQGLDELPVVMAGQQSLSLVFTNLLENASDAMDGRGAVSIAGTSIGGWVEVVIQDSGPGIPPELHSRIFEFSFSGRGTRHVGKLGFGLWWVKTLMARLGGSVSLESNGDRGATFRLRLPCAEV